MYVDYKGSTGLDTGFTCLLRVSAKSVKDNGRKGLFVIALKKSESLLEDDRSEA